MEREKHKRRRPRGESTDAEHWDGPIRISDEGSQWGRSEGIGSGGLAIVATDNRRTTVNQPSKPFNIDKRGVSLTSIPKLRARLNFSLYERIQCVFCADCAPRSSLR